MEIGQPMKRSQAQMAESVENSAGGKKKMKFSSFEPKKFRPRKSDASAPPPPCPSEASSSQGVELKTMEAVEVAADVNSNKSRKAAYGRTASTIYARTIPDDATYKTELVVTANFDCAFLLSSCFSNENIKEATPQTRAMKKLVQRWKETHVVWCYPSRCNSSVEAAADRDRHRHARAASGAEDAKGLWAAAAHAGIQLFIDGSIDNFLIHSPGLTQGITKPMLSAAFYMDLDSSTSEEMHCCVVAGVNTEFMRRLQARGVLFEVLLPFSEGSPGQWSPVSLTQGFKSISVSKFSSGTFYKLRVFRKESVAAVADLIIEQTLSREPENFAASVPQLVSSRPFLFASVSESSLVSVQSISEYAKSGNAVDILQADYPQRSTQIESKPSEMVRFAFRGYFTTDAIQALASVMIGLAVLHKNRDRNSSDARGCFASSRIPLTSDFIDDTCFDSRFLRMQKRLKATTEQPVSTVGKDPFRLSTSMRTTRLTAMLATPSPTSASNNDLKFQIRAQDFIGVPFLSPISLSQKVRLKLPPDQLFFRAFVLGEISWCIAHDDISKVRKMISKYQIEVIKYDIEYPVRTLSLLKEIARKADAREESMKLEPFNEYSVYAS